MTLEHFSRETAVADIVAGLDVAGAVVLDDLLDAAAVDQLVGDFYPVLDAEPWCNTSSSGALDEGDSFFGLKTKRLHGLAGLSTSFESVLLDDLVLSVARRVLASEQLIQSTAELMAIGDGEAQQAFHRDGDSWYRVPEPHGELLFSINVASR